LKKFFGSYFSFAADELNLKRYNTFNSNMPITQIKDSLIFLTSFVSVVIIPLYIYKLNNRFFYIDDKVSEYIPKLLDIASILKEGEFPFLSTNFMNGSVYAAEYAEGIFNPIILLSSLLLDSFDNLAFGACILTTLFLLIGFYGFYLLAVEIGIRKSWASIFALSATFNCFYIYWCASSWFNPVNSTAFLPYALYSAIALKRKVSFRSTFFFITSCYLVASAGWPLTLIILFLFLALQLIDILFVKKDVQMFICNMGIYCATGLICTLPLLPLFLSNDMFTRNSALGINNANFCVGSLKGLLMFSFPAFQDIMHTWGGYSKLQFSNYYTGWFALPLIAYLNYSSTKIRENQVWILVVLTIICGVAVMGPELIGPIRFPIRFIHYYHIFGILLLLILFERSGLVFTKNRTGIFLFIFLFQIIFALQVNPENVKIILIYSFILLSLSFLLLLLFAEGREYIGDVLALTVTIGIFFAIYGLNHHGRGTDWNTPEKRSNYSSLSSSNGYILFNGGYLSSKDQHKEYRPATMGLIWNDKIVNGYSPLGNRFFREKIAIEDHGNIQTKWMKKRGKEFFEIDEGTGMELVELMKVNKIISFKGSLGTDLKQAASDKWVMKEKAYTFVFEHNPYTLPGRLSWIDPNIEVKTDISFQHAREEYVLENSGPKSGRVVFARLWWPGYRAFWGEKELEVQRYSGFLLSVLIPANSKDVLKLLFVPPGFVLSITFAVAGTVIALLFVLYARKQHTRGIFFNATV
jgi:hypothetical protein